MATTCWCMSTVSLPLASTSTSQNQKSSIISCKRSSSRSFGGLRDSAFSTRVFRRTRELSRCGVVCMAPDEEKMTRRSPLDFPIEWERPKPGRRPDIFPKFSPMKTPLPTPLPADPPEEDEEEEERKEEEEEDPEKEEEEDDKPKGV